jgi:hypothetical protein
MRSASSAHGAGLGSTAPETRLLAARNRYLVAGSTAGSCLLELTLST